MGKGGRDRRKMRSAYAATKFPMTDFLPFHMFIWKNLIKGAALYYLILINDSLDRSTTIKMKKKMGERLEPKALSATALSPETV